MGSACTTTCMAKGFQGDDKGTPQFNGRINGTRGCSQAVSEDDNLIKKPLDKTATTLLPKPRISPNDKKEYRAIRLANGLRALLIADLKKPTNESSQETKISNGDSGTVNGLSEKEAEEISNTQVEENIQEDDETKKKAEKEENMAAAALCIKAGSFSDPPEIPGLAHFLEYMVFMGSEKYPEENDFSSFVSKNGGTFNATTEREITLFYFSMQQKNFEEGLDKLAQFFISPLMKEDAISREIKAVDSEYEMALTSDGTKLDQVLCSIADKSHPINKFRWGNKKTLQDDVSEKELYKRVHEFRERHYSSHYMTLTVQACQDLDTLQEWVEKYFSDVPNNGLHFETFGHFGNPFSNCPSFNRIYKVIPSNDVCQLQLLWPLPFMRNLYKTKPGVYVAWLVGHEGKGSVLSYLKKKVWALSLDAGLDEYETHSMFQVYITLTEEGLANLQHVVQAVISYIAMLQKVGPQEHIFNEIKQKMDTRFRFMEENPAMSYVSFLCRNMHHYPPEDYLGGPFLVYAYAPEQITKYLRYLKPRPMSILLLSKSLEKEGICNTIEPWFQAQYCTEEIPDEWLESWDAEKIGEHFHLPEPNIYLSTNFSLLPFDSKDEPHPVEILREDCGELWYRRDTKFKLPTASYSFQIISPVAESSPQNEAMLAMFSYLLSDQMTEEGYDAQLASLNYFVSSVDKGIGISVSGYNHKLLYLLKTIVKKLKKFRRNIDPKMFEVLKDQLSKGYYNSVLHPSCLADEVRLSLIIEVYWMSIEDHKALEDVTVDKILYYMDDFLRTSYIQCLVQGNVSQEQAVNAYNMVKTILRHDCHGSPLIESRVAQVPLGESACRVKSFNDADTNSIIHNYYQFGPKSLRDTCIIELVMLIMEEPVFNILRTKEQLGYNVYSMDHDTNGILGFSITVNYQAHKHNADHVNERIEEFLKTFKDQMENQSEEEFENFKTSLIKSKQTVDLDLYDEVSSNWSEITSLDYMFDRKTREVQCIKTLTQQEVKEWFFDLIACGTKKNFRKLSIQVIGNENASTADSTSAPTPAPAPDVPRAKTKRQLLRRKSTQLSMSLDAPTDTRYHCLQFLKDTGSSSEDITWIDNIKAFKQRAFVYPDVQGKSSQYNMKLKRKAFFGDSENSYYAL